MRQSEGVMAMVDTNSPPPRSEEFQFSGDTLIAKVKEIIRAGNVRRVIIKNEEGRVLIDVPLTLGVVGTLLAPQLAAIGAIAALVLKGSIVIEKEVEPVAPTTTLV
jgi:hypothetical protein